jgi:hypothetical protein
MAAAGGSPQLPQSAWSARRACSDASSRAGLAPSRHCWGRRLRSQKMPALTSGGLCTVSVTTTGSPLQSTTRVAL